VVIAERGEDCSQPTDGSALSLPIIFGLSVQNLGDVLYNGMSLVAELFNLGHYCLNQ
jgi:hypothetical protein